MEGRQPQQSVRRDVRKFFGRVAVMAALVVAGNAAILFAPTEKASYLAAVIDKQARLRSLPSPKLVLVGGSNLSFAIDSARLERELGMPVANMGLGIYAGLRFMLGSVVDALGPGDVVVVSAEYQLYRGLYDGEEELLEVLEAYPKGLSTVGSTRQVAGLARALPAFIKNKANRIAAPLFQASSPTCVYCRRAFNPYGDIVASLPPADKNVAEMAMFRSKSEKGPIDPQAIAGLAEFVRRSTERGARVVVMYPAIPEPHFAANRPLLEEVDARIRKLVPVPILGGPGENVMPVGLFYDWVYHLLPAGRDARTAVVVERLRAFVAAEP